MLYGECTVEGGRIVQSGTPRDIYSDPANDYVADFVANMNPLGVLCARDVMEPASGAHSETVAPDTPINEVMERVIASGQPVAVEDGGAVLGQVTRETVLTRFLDPQSD